MDGQALFDGSTQAGAQPTPSSRHNHPVASIINKLTGPINDALPYGEQVVSTNRAIPSPVRRIEDSLWGKLLWKPAGMKIHCITATYADGRVHSLRCITRRTAEILAEQLTLKEPSPVTVRIREGNCKCPGEPKEGPSTHSASPTTRP